MLYQEAAGTASLSARRAWIEISPLSHVSSQSPVALRKESVDRNQTRYALLQALQSLSARRAWIEISGVSPPVELWKTSLSARRAWIEMQGRQHTAHKRLWSLSARRAWIEIAVPSFTDFGDDVALRKESVDRNLTHSGHPLYIVVALRKESVDRNTEKTASSCLILCRSPQGERG